MSGVAYIEAFEIFGSQYGIEDYKDGRPDEDHFMAEKFRARQYKRFHMWRNGCGIGQAKTLKEARQVILEYALDDINRQLTKAQQVFTSAEATLKKLGTDPAHLFKFSIEAEDAA